MTRLFLVAGEPSGDLLGAALIDGLRRLDISPHLAGVGGPAMEAAGLVSQFPMEELSVMGITEVLPQMPNLLRRIRETADAVVAMRPDALVTIDSPDFCMRVARKVRSRMPDLKIIHYVAPSVWAWRPGRAAKMAEVVNHVLALLPFEPPYMEAAGMTCDFVGHPAAALPIATPEETAALRAEMGIAPDQPMLVLLPGSRRSEVERLAPDFAEVFRRLRAGRPDLAALVPATPAVVDLVATLMPPGADGWPRVLDPRGFCQDGWEIWKRTAFAAADGALAASGTVSLELAAAETPMVIGYRAGRITTWIAKQLVRVDSATLVNLVTGTHAVPEFLAERCTPELLTPAVADLLDDPVGTAEQLRVGAEAMTLLGRGGEPPGLRAARSVLNQIGKKAVLPVT